MSNKSEFDIDDFLEVEIEIDSGKKKFTPTARLADFADIKLSRIDPAIKEEVLKRLENVRSNLIELKSTLKNF